MILVLAIRLGISNNCTNNEHICHQHCKMTYCLFGENVFVFHVIYWKYCPICNLTIQHLKIFYTSYCYLFFLDQHTYIFIHPIGKWITDNSLYSAYIHYSNDSSIICSFFFAIFKIGLFAMEATNSFFFYFQVFFFLYFFYAIYKLCTSSFR